ncbi:hypothetical protein ACIQU6_33755 [Streptomyces sp. NPDC090442]|uniref:hypothetical protein n=1 Tax=Streptomyces sp. NPDC090442 TaxID=3365962 RepID=UPI0038042B47
MDSPGIRRILAGVHEPGVIDLAEKETLLAVAGHFEEYARSILDALATLPQVAEVPSIRRGLLERKGILRGYNRPLDGQWSAPGSVSTEPMLGVVTGRRTLERDYQADIPPYWSRRSPLLRTSRIFWYSDYVYMVTSVPTALRDWTDLAWIMASGFELGVVLDYWEKLRFNDSAVKQAWRDVTDSVQVAGRIGRLDVLWHCVFGGLLAYANHCGEFENRSILELRCFEVGGYAVGRAIVDDHKDAMLLGLVVGIGHDLLESGTDITNREEHNLWVSLTDGCCCPECLGALEDWLVKWLSTSPSTAGHLTAWSFAGYFCCTWLSERHGVTAPTTTEVPDTSRCRGAVLLRQVLAAADSAGARQVDIVERSVCGLHVAQAMPAALPERRALHDQLTRDMIGSDGLYCGCLSQTFIDQLRTRGLRSIIAPWIREVTPASGHRVNR